ncbi:hypothetical protein ACHHYP_20466 [Achlya hypogyna]|uniref:Uncharacterized protein n=1 Tax=Achlya hypogyna TaxID=1202772 RepID=A0A1V9YLV1_ACHHY|nr:hypothetical protein ACHHYP_20466 [Achlya hypogyna]
MEFVSRPAPFHAAKRRALGVAATPVTDCEDADSPFLSLSAASPPADDVKPALRVTSYCYATPAPCLHSRPLPRQRLLKRPRSPRALRTATSVLVLDDFTEGEMLASLAVNRDRFNATCAVAQ